jgi:hypothetical protein
MAQKGKQVLLGQTGLQERMVLLVQTEMMVGPLFWRLFLMARVGCIRLPTIQAELALSPLPVSMSVPPVLWQRSAMHPIFAVRPGRLALVLVT